MSEGLKQGHVQSFRDLKIWQLGMEIVRSVYRLCEKVPAQEQFGLIAQMRRAAIALPANVAEGCRRHHSSEFRQFLRMSLGSSAELETYLELCKSLYQLNGEEVTGLIRTLEQLQRMTSTLINRLPNHREQ